MGCLELNRAVDIGLTAVRNAVSAWPAILPLATLSLSACSVTTTIGILDGADVSATSGESNTSNGTTTGSGTGTTGTGTTGSPPKGPCGGSNPPCLPGLDCVNGLCLIPVHSTEYPCSDPSFCEADALGDATNCEESVCCDTLERPCAVQNDCCTGDYCLNHVCVLETLHGFCDGGQACLSGNCDIPTSYCACTHDGFPAHSYLQCCSGQLNSVGSACAPRTVGASCPTRSCSPNTEQCQQGSCCITSLGSEIEPCDAGSDCCQSPVMLNCNRSTCCNLLDGPCMTNDDCCFSHTCNAVNGQVGQCKLNSQIFVCRADADCLFGSCNLDSGICN
jgi:hypothetical protein